MLLQTSIEDNQEHQSNVTYKIQQVETSNKSLQQETETIMATLPQLSSTIHSQNQQLQRTIDDNTDFCQVTSETISTIQHQQSNMDFRIDNIQALLNKVIHKSTPSSSVRNRKESKSADQTQVNLFANASDGDYDDHLPTIQLEMLLNNNTSAISNALNTTNESTNMSFKLQNYLIIGKHHQLMNTIITRGIWATHTQRSTHSPVRCHRFNDH
jgi:seryl-tRNA synthetase